MPVFDDVRYWVVFDDGDGMPTVLEFDSESDARASWEATMKARTKPGIRRFMARVDVMEADPVD